MKRIIRIAAVVLIACSLVSVTIDLGNLFNYEDQVIPDYITRDNIVENPISDEGATLGRVLFYDKKLSSNNTIACASCHHQEFAFGDTSLVSLGVNGVTGRHSMRLVNSRFAEEAKFFWDERANSLEDQSTMPIRDHIEMGYSGTNGDPTFEDLLNKLDTVSYYNDLFDLAFGDTIITEQRMQLALAQFIRSMQSFDSPYDVGKAQVGYDSLPFPNFSQAQNNGKSIFITPPVFNNNGLRIGGGFGCASCHRPPEFDIDPTSRSNGVVFTPGNTRPTGGTDLVVFKSPSLRDVVNQDGEVNGLLMHTANFGNLTMVLNHYDRINLFQQAQGISAAIDERLIPNGRPQDLNMTNQERNQVIAFLGTLTGTNIYTDEKWSNPFDENGQLEILNGSVVTSTADIEKVEFSVYPNPVINELNIRGAIHKKTLEVYRLDGRFIQSIKLSNDQTSISLANYASGTYLITLVDAEGKKVAFYKIIKI